MSVPFFDYRAEYGKLQTEIDAAIRRVLDSGRLILGPEVSAFEEEWAAYCGVPHAVGVNSGTDALILALRVMGIGHDDEVITVANAGAPPVAAIRAVGAIPVFVDIDPDTMLLDPTKLEEAAGPRCKAILPVHLYGLPAPMQAILDFAQPRGLKVIEDCAQAHGATYRGRHVGSWGDVGCFSFYPTKNLGAYGDGGAVVTRDAGIAEGVREQRMYGFRGDRDSHVEGLNSRLDELQAAILRVKLSHYPEALDERRALAKRYCDALAGSELRMQVTAPETTHAYHLWVVRPPDRGSFVAELTQHEIGYGMHYPTPCHRMDAYSAFANPERPLRETERACDEVVSLPLYNGLGADKVEFVVRLLRPST